MEKSRNNKILNYFILIKIFNGDRNLAIKFYLLVNDFTKNVKKENIFFQLSLFDNFKKIDYYEDIWANDINKVLWFIYESNMQINWKDDKKSLAITIIKNKLKVNYSSDFIHEVINIISNFKEDMSIEKIFNNNGTLVHYDDEIYPKYFKENIDYPPICFFYEGNFNLLTKKKIISIVGTRHPSKKGFFYTEKIAFELMRMNSVIVSGLAKGVDSIAHLFCQNQGYKNVIAVIGTPISKFYPRENKDLQIWIKENGLLLSEYAEFELTLKFNFLRRNNFMSMISMISIVVEASDTSGTISQARNTLKNKRYLLTPQKTFDDPNNSWPRNFQEKFENFVYTFENKNEFLQKVEFIFEK